MNMITIRDEWERVRQSRFVLRREDEFRLVPVAKVTRKQTAIDDFFRKFM